MLPAEKVAASLEGSLRSDDIIALAIVTPSGTVLESRGAELGSDRLFPLSPDGVDTYAMSYKLLTKVYALFAAEYWHSLGPQQPEWCGAQAGDHRLVITGLGSLLLLAVGSTSAAWGVLSQQAAQVRNDLTNVSSFDIDVRGI